ncbi:LOW QUALITY PROTEIN: hypothetical protein J0S82_015274, partial [Galemys pyrenaicus]
MQGASFGVPRSAPPLPTAPLVWVHGLGRFFQAATTTTTATEPLPEAPGVHCARGQMAQPLSQGSSSRTRGPDGRGSVGLEAWRPQVVGLEPAGPTVWDETWGDRRRRGKCPQGPQGLEAKAITKVLDSVDIEANDHRLSKRVNGKASKTSSRRVLARWPACLPVGCRPLLSADPGSAAAAEESEKKKEELEESDRLGWKHLHMGCEKINKGLWAWDTSAAVLAQCKGLRGPLLSWAHSPEAKAI